MRYRFLVCLALAIQSAAVVGQTLTSSDLPIVVLDTDGEAIVDDPKIPAAMGIIHNGDGIRNNVTDPFNDYDGRIGIEIRGSSSQMFPKKQYGVELWDENNDGIDASLLGFPEEEDWILFAPYNDKTLMRDVLAYKLGRDMGRYAPRTKYCEVILNGQYDGVYVLIEKIKRDNNRVDINKLDPDEIAGNSLTGGYIVKIDKTTGSGGEGWFSTHEPLNNQNGQRVYFQYEEPAADDIVPEQADYIQQFIASFEDALAGDEFTDPENGYAKYIDVGSFVDYFILNEVTKNVDAYRLSTFVHKQRDSDGGKLVMGPIWDYNLGFGNADYCTDGDPEGFVVKSFNSICPADAWLIPFWWDRLLQDPLFREQVAARWNELRQDKFATETILSHVDSLANVLAESQQRNFQRWPVLGTYVWPNYYVGNTFQQEVDWLKNWIEERIEWLDFRMQNIVTSVSDEGNRVSLKAMPNPFVETLHIEYVLTRTESVHFEFFDSTGKKMTDYFDPLRTAGTHSLQIDTRNFSTGLYYYTFNTNTQRSAGKVVRAAR